MAEIAVAPPRRNRLLLAQWSELLENDSFRRFFLMRLAATGAVNALSYALLVFTVRESTSALATGGLLLTVLVPSAMLGAVAGSAVDRLPRGLILFASNLLRALLMFALIGAKDSLASIYLVGLALGVISQFAVPAESAVLPHIVRQDKLTAANSFLSLGSLATQVAGMLIVAPALLKTTDGDPLLFLLLALFVFAAAIITVIPQFHFSFAAEHRHGLTLRAARRQFAEGWMTMARDPVAYLSLVLSVVASVSTLVVATLLPKFSDRVLHIPPENIVFVLAPVAIGIFLGLRSVEWLADRFNKMVTISGAYLLMAATLMLLGLVPATAAAIVDSDPLGMFSRTPLNDQSARIAVTVLHGSVYGFAVTVVGTMGKVLLNERVPVEMQGRIFAAQSVLSNLAAIPPVLAGGLLADAVGVEPVLIAAGCVALAAAVWSRAQGSKVVPAGAL
ncbi:MAG TPA: MFS transporter [Dehalococcoidia bacterium]|nr:MFS transporter [Dehalococcoidia bacterium]